MTGMVSKIKDYFRMVITEKDQIDEALLQYILAKYQSIPLYYPILRTTNDEVALFVPHLSYGGLFLDHEIALIFIEFGLEASIRRECITDVSRFSCCFGIGPLDCVVRVKIKSKTDILRYFEASPYARMHLYQMKLKSYIQEQKERAEEIKQHELMNSISWASV